VGDKFRYFPELRKKYCFRAQTVLQLKFYFPGTRLAKSLVMHPSQTTAKIPFLPTSRAQAKVESEKVSLTPGDSLK